MHEEIKEVIKKIERQENLIIMGGWNAVIEESREGKVMRNYGFGRRNLCRILY